MKPIAFPTGFLLVILLGCFVMIRARAQDQPANPIVPLDLPVPTLQHSLQPPLPDSLAPVAPADSLLIAPPPLDPFDQPHFDAHPTESSISTLQSVLQQIGLKPTIVRDELFCRFKTTYKSREWKFSISAKAIKDSQTVELYAWLNKYPAEPSEAERLQARALKINDPQMFHDAILPHEFRFRDHRLTLCRVLNAKDCEQTRRLAREIQTLAGMVAANYSSWSEIGTPILSQSEGAQATSDAIDPVSCQPTGPPNLTPPAGDGSLLDLDPSHRPFLGDKFFATDSTGPRSDPDSQDVRALQIVRLKTVQASEAVSTLQQLFGDSQANFAADKRTNSVILRGRQPDLQVLIELLEQLDSVESPAPKQTKPQRLRSADEVRLEKQAMSLKGQLDEETARSTDRKPADSEARVKDLIQQIRSAVDESFNERQRQQLSEIEELTVRLNKLSKAVREREAKREAIIEQRISELIGSGDEEPSMLSRSQNSPLDGIGPRVAGYDDLSSAGPSGMPGLGGGGLGGRGPDIGMMSGMGMGLMGGMGMGGSSGIGSSDAAGNPRGMDVEDLSQNLSLTDVAAKGHSLRKSIAEKIELIPALQHKISLYEATPDGRMDADAARRKYLAAATLALQQEREECSTYLQLLSIEYAAAEAEHERTTQELGRLRELATRGVVPSQEVTAAEAAYAKTNAAVQRLGVLMKLFTDIERLKTPDGPESPPEQSRPDVEAPGFLKTPSF